MRKPENSNLNSNLKKYNFNRDEMVFTAPRDEIVEDEGPIEDVYDGFNDTW